LFVLGALGSLMLAGCATDGLQTASVQRHYRRAKVEKSGTGWDTSILPLAILEIISFASRAFALYYLLQCIVAIIACRHHYEHRVRHLHSARFATVAGILTFIVIFAMPAK